MSSCPTAPQFSDANNNALQVARAEMTNDPDYPLFQKEVWLHPDFRIDFPGARNGEEFSAMADAAELRHFRRWKKNRLAAVIVSKPEEE